MKLKRRIDEHHVIVQDSRTILWYILITEAARDVSSKSARSPANPAQSEANERTNEIDSTGDWKRVSLTKGISHTRQICPPHSSTRDLCARALISQPDTFAITHIVSRNQWKNKNLRSRARTREISIGFSLLLIRLASASIVHKNQISEERFAKSVFFATFLTICVQSVLENWQTGWIEKTDRVEHWINSNDDFMCIIAHSMTANYCFVFTPVIPSAWQWLLTSECPG